MDLQQQLEESSKVLSDSVEARPHRITVYLDSNNRVVDDPSKAVAARILHFSSDGAMTGTTYTYMQNNEPGNGGLIANDDGITSHDAQGGEWVTISDGPNNLAHRLVSAPDDYDIVGKGKKPTSPISLPERASIDHLTVKEIKHQDILHYHQHKILAKINSGKASHEDHQRFSQIRERLNELHHLASRRQEDKELYDQFMEDSAAQQQAEWERAKGADELSPAELAERKLRDKHKRAEDKLKAKRVKELRDHFDGSTE